MHRNTPRHITALAMLCLALTACGGVTQYAEDAVYRSKEKAEEELARLKEQVSEYKPRELVEFSDNVWVGSSSHVFTNSIGPLPASVRDQNKVVLVTATPVNLTEAGWRITELSGVPVFSELAGEAANYLAPVRYSGDLRGLLDRVAETFGAHWFYDDQLKSIRFSQLVTRIFDYYAPPSNVSISSSVGGSGGSGGGGGDEGGGDEGGSDSGGGGGGGSGSVSFSRSSSYDDWEDISEIIGNIIPQGSSFSMSPASGKITVTTTPGAMRRVAEIIRDRNQYLAKQVHLSVQVLALEIVAEEDYGFDPNEINIANVLEKALGVDIGSGEAVYRSGFNLPDSTGLVINTQDLAIDPETGGTLRDEGNVNLIFSALNTIGKVSVVTTAETRARNGRPVPIQSTAVRSYIAETSSAVNSETGVIETTLTPGQFTTGMLMNIRPRVLARENVQMEVGFSLQSLNALRVFEAGTNRVEQPDIATRAFSQEVIVPNGATLLLSGLERQANDAQKQGVGSANNLLLGGRRNSEASRSTAIILITPTIVKQ